MTMGWQAFGRASPVYKDKNIPMVLKRRTDDRLCILLRVKYGKETWNLKKKQTLKLRTIHRAHERIMFNII